MRRICERTDLSQELCVFTESRRIYGRERREPLKLRVCWGESCHERCWCWMSESGGDGMLLLLGEKEEGGDREKEKRKEIKRIEDR